MDQTSHPPITPCVALLLALVYGCTIALQMHMYVSMSLILFFLAWLKRRFLLIIFKRLVMLNTLIVFIALTLYWQHQEHLAGLMLLRSNLMLLCILLLFHGCNEFTIAIAMQRLALPHKITTLFFFTSKSIFLIRHELVLFKNTLRIRGFTPKTDLLSYKTLAGFIGTLVIKALERSVALQKAMLLRGFQGEIYTLSRRQSLSSNDAIATLLTLISLFWHQGYLL